MYVYNHHYYFQNFFIIPTETLPTDNNSSFLSTSSPRNGEGNGNPLQYSCLANPMDGGAWWAAVHGVTRSRTWLSNFTFTFYFSALEKEMATHSCFSLENPRDGGAWWVAIYGVAQSRTWLKRLSSSSPRKLLFYFLHPWICVFWKPHEWNHRILILSCLAFFSPSIMFSRFIPAF